MAGMIMDRLDGTMGAHHLNALLPSAKETQKLGVPTHTVQSTTHTICTLNTTYAQSMPVEQLTTYIEPNSLSFT